MVSATAPSQYTLVLTLTHKYNPSFFTNNQLGPAALTPMPSTEWNVASAGGPHLDYTVPANAESIYNYLSQQGSTVSTFATNPLWQDVDGPFKLSSFTASSGAFTLVPNSSYGGSPKPGFSELEAEPFTSLTAELNQVKLGDLDIAGIDFSQLGQVNQLKADGYSVFGSPSFGFDDAILNFKDKTGDFNNIVAQLYIRQAFASLIDEPGVLKGVLKGAGSLDYGTIPEEPSSPFAPANATKPPYPFSTTAAAKLLSSHGWKVVPNGTTKCVKPGTGAGECGKGIPAGTPIKFTWYYANLAPYVGQMSEAFASSASSIGIHVTLTSKTFDFLTSNFNDASSADAKYDNTWGVVDFTGFNNQYYPTTNTIFNTTGSFNIGGYSAKANSLIKASEFSSGPDAVKAEASYLTINVPSLFLPDPDNIFAVKKGIGGPANGWMAATLFTYLPQYWYQTK